MVEHLCLHNGKQGRAGRAILGPALSPLPQPAAPSCTCTAPAPGLLMSWRFMATGPPRLQPHHLPASPPSPPATPAPTSKCTVPAPGLLVPCRLDTRIPPPNTGLTTLPASLPACCTCTHLAPLEGFPIHASGCTSFVLSCFTHLHVHSACARLLVSCGCDTHTPAHGCSPSSHFNQGLPTSTSNRCTHPQVHSACAKLLLQRPQPHHVNAPLPQLQPTTPPAAPARTSTCTAPAPGCWCPVASQT